MAPSERSETKHVTVAEIAVKSRRVETAIALSRRDFRSSMTQSRRRKPFQGDGRYMRGRDRGLRAGSPWLSDHSFAKHTDELLWAASREIMVMKHFMVAFAPHLYMHGPK